MLGYCVTASLRGTEDNDLRSLLQAHHETAGRARRGMVGGLWHHDDRGWTPPGGDLGRWLLQPERRGQGRPVHAAQRQLGGKSIALPISHRDGHETQRPAGPLGAGVVGEWRWWPQILEFRPRRCVRRCRRRSAIAAGGPQPRPHRRAQRPPARLDAQLRGGPGSVCGRPGRAGDFGDRQGLLSPQPGHPGGSLGCQGVDHPPGQGQRYMASRVG